MGPTPVSSPRIGIYRTRYLGDLVLFVPVLHKLLEQTKPENLFIVVNEGTEFPLKQLGVPFFPFDRGTFFRKMRSLEKLKSILRKQFFDFWIDMTLSDRSRHVTRSVRANVRAACGNPQDRREREPYDLFVPVDYNRGPGHVVDLWEQVFREAGLLLSVGEKNASIPVDPEAFASVESFLVEKELSGRPLLAIHPGGRHWFKRWPPDRFGRLALWWHQAKGGAVILVSTPHENTLADSVRSAVPPEVKVSSFRGTVPELHALFSRADLFVGNDSGPLHLTRSAGAPVLGFFGSTLPAVWGPLKGPSTRMLYHPMPCSPCDHTGCTMGESNCLRQITVEESIDLIRNMDRDGSLRRKERV